MTASPRGSDDQPGPARPASDTRPVMGVDAAGLTPVFAAIADDTRWSILAQLGAQALSASSLAERMPVSRQAIAKHLAVLDDAGLVAREPHGREVRYRAVGSRLTDTADALAQIGAGWERRLAGIRSVAERL